MEEIVESVPSVVELLAAAVVAPAVVADVADPVEDKEPAEVEQDIMEPVEEEAAVIRELDTSTPVRLRNSRP